MCRAEASRDAPSTVPTRGRIGGIWSMPATSPLAIDGTDPINTTKYTVDGVTPNHSTAAGTQATDGRLCRPDSSGPIAARTTRTFATSRPSGVAKISAPAKPMNAGLPEVQRIDQTLPSATALAKACHASIGAGNLYSSVIAD